MSNLVELLNESTKIEIAIIEAGGEITPELEAELALTKEQIETKLDQYDYIVKSLLSRSQFYKLQADKFYCISKALSLSEDRIKDRIKMVMIENNLTELSGNDVKYKLVNSNPRLILDEKQIHENYQIITYSPDKERIKEDLKAGKTVDGARLEPTVSLRSFVKSK